MTVKALRALLASLPDQNAVIDMSSDEEGNNFGDIDKDYTEGFLQKNGQRVYTLFPVSSEQAEDRYQ